jgi:hypothetical protein
MSEGESQRIARELLSEPHIRGHRISVRQVYAPVEERGEDPDTDGYNFVSIFDPAGGRNRSRDYSR